MQLNTIHRYVVAIGVANNVSKTYKCYKEKEWLNDQATTYHYNLIICMKVWTKDPRSKWSEISGVESIVNRFLG